MYRLPSLTALRAFDCVARHKSFAKAAEELCVTAPSLSHHVKALEAELGFKLFIRGHRSISLTAKGEALLATTSSAFGSLNATWHDLRNAPASFRMTCGVHFTTNWLAARSARLQVLLDGVEIDHVTTFEKLSFEAGEVDLAIRNGNDKVVGYHSETIYQEWWTPMTSPEIASALEAPSDMLRYPIIEARHHREPKGHPTASDWLKAAGVDEEHPDIRLIPHTETAMQMAAESVGIKLCASVLADQLHLQGKLVAPFKLAIRRQGFRFYMVCRKGEEREKLVSQIRDFFRQEFSEMDARFGVDRMSIITLPAIADG